MGARFLQITHHDAQILAMRRWHVVYVIELNSIIRRDVFGSQEPGVIRNHESSFLEQTPDFRVVAHGYKHPGIRVAVVAATCSLIAIIFGNWLYIYYRAPIPESPRSFFVKNAPEIHRIFFEFKEFGALFTLPLTVVAAFILWRYGAQVLDRPWLRYTVAVLMGLAFFYLVIAFGLGAAVTKLRPA